MYRIKNSKGIEDIFTKTDFKKHILNDTALAFDDLNSTYMKGKQKAVVAVQFMLKVEDGLLKIEDLNMKTQEKIRSLVNTIESLLD